ncbi:DUF4391 domain-containing protein [Paraeggerthella sp. LCP19S3_G8]|uniref:DUF4391 domain-containing protein n=1 Tax=Paraeggerthella sp. LCP19S3_G8 TaxID=3440248 RepID=UPI003F94A6C8
MSGVDWNGILRLPDAALAGCRRIPKTVLAKQAMLTKTEQKRLDKVARLDHFATVQKSTTRIPPYEDDERNVQSIVFLRCEMAKGVAYAEEARLIHKCFPNPTVVLFDGTGEACISLATTRKSKAEQGAMVIDAIESTGAFDPGDPAYASLLDALELAKLPQDDLLAYLQGIGWVVRLSRSIASLGFYPVCAKHDRERLSELIARSDVLVMQVADARQCRCDRELTLNESAKLRMELKELERELNDVGEKIAALCAKEVNDDRAR